MATASDRIYGIQARESLDKIVLFAAFVLGMSGTVWLKISEAPIVAVALFPVAVLVAYVAACLIFRDIGTEPETIGDNSYYLGFLFTLASLAVTLYRIGDISADEADLIPAVIAGFGVALSSTIGGVFLRVFLLQLRPDIVARDRAARRDLATGARELRDAVTHASRVLKSVSIETQQLVGERNAKMSEVLEIQVHETSVLLERQAAAYDEIIRQFGQKLTEEIGSVLRKEAEITAHDLKISTKAFRDGIDALGASRAEAEAELQASLYGFRTAVDAMKAATVQHGKSTEGSYRTLAARSAKVSEALVSASDTVDRAAAQARRAIDKAQASADASRESARQEEQVLRQHASGVTRAMRQLETALNDQAKAVENGPLIVRPSAAISEQSLDPSAAEDSAPHTTPLTVGQPPNHWSTGMAPAMEPKKLAGE